MPPEDECVLSASLPPPTHAFFLTAKRDEADIVWFMYSILHYFVAFMKTNREQDRVKPWKRHSDKLVLRNAISRPHAKADQNNIFE